MFDVFPSREVAVILFGWPVHWYGLLYLFSFLIAYPLLPRLARYRELHLTEDQWSQVLTFAIIGVIGGGRLGYVLFYQPLYYLANPLEIVAVWHGGMSSHGGFIAVIAGLIYNARRFKIPFPTLGDVIVIPVAIGLAMGRLGNFINLELYGTVTTLPWGIEIPGVNGLRHPTQIYAMMKDLLIVAVCYGNLRWKKGAYHGETASIFLMLYAVLRFSVEFLRVPDAELTRIGSILLTRGQFLSLWIFVGGVCGLLWSRSLKIQNSGSKSS